MLLPELLRCPSLLEQGYFENLLFSTCATFGNKSQTPVSFVCSWNHPSLVGKMMPSPFWCFQNPNRWRRSDLHGDTLRRSRKVGDNLDRCSKLLHCLLGFGVTQTNLESYSSLFLVVVRGFRIKYPVTSILIASKPDTTIQMALCVSFDLVYCLFLTSCSGCSMPGDDVPESQGGAAAQRYKLSQVPASRGHCCSINFSKCLVWDLLWLFSLMFYRASMYLDNLLHLQSLICWGLKTQLCYHPGPGNEELFVMPVFCQECAADWHQHCKLGVFWINDRQEDLKSRNTLWICY